ncbi:MAG TPA: ATP-binding cassette domain-containing protein [Leptolyngbyaceae cyanobacterium M33_DOE_097]|uniref:ATP-binding cassette domain-containing protein n=1 Tax=Oscillatoriales cyanobacterium SpSt-418 TaxID=2282169 RepID=A0A7C3KFL5_9CYAN|nr:ATP-binding cassette domain-containing protein [Leptolyngbyaceae cyanobacterium M33_DOE_097]
MDNLDGQHARDWVGVIDHFQIRAEQVSWRPRLFQGQVTADPNAPYLLHDLSFTIQAGDRVGLVGASGAGKTLLLRLLNRLIEPTEGTLYYNNQAYAQISPIGLRQEIVLVPQEPKLLGMTVREALEYPLTLRQLPSHTIKQRVSEALDQLNIPAEWLERTELQLSVGQRQWVAIARALVTHPKVLLLDEPTSALDVGRSQRLIQALQGLTQTHHTAVVMANHQLEIVKEFCDRLMQLQQGKMVQNAAASTVEWADLRQGLIDAETQQADEWGE